jgi:transcriptional/translational regulatory protein YebC/TACO1
VVEALHTAKIETISAEVAMLPMTTVRLEGRNAQSMLKMSELFEDHDDVQSVYSNFDIDEKEMEALA